MRSNEFLKISIVLLLCLGSFQASAQDYWVFFKDKCTKNTDYFNTPICAEYLQKVKTLGVDIKGTSRWLNAILIESDDLDKLKDCDMVSSYQALANYLVNELHTDEIFPYGEGDWQQQLIGIDSLHRKGYTGKGITIGVFDGGFYNMDSIPGFDSLWANGLIKASYDFVFDDSMRFDQSAHGMQVMGLLGAQYNDSLVGSAPHSNYVLARTEKTGSETHQEEFNWIKAMEWADSVGVDIIHSSLGYSLFDSLQGNYSYQDMDGNSTIITIAAEQAASRGIFITNSAGNSGNDPWKYITAPCDGKSVLCIGAVDSFGNKASFSSFGPSADGRVKPDVMAMGVRNTIFTPNGVLRRGSGTSFSAPIIAGGVACLMQAHPNASNQEIYQAIIQSCDRYDMPDSSFGYGIPDMVKADSILSVLASIESPKTLNIKVFPNPATNELKVIAPPYTNCKIFSMNGQLIMEQKLLNWYNFLDVSSLHQGIYFIEVSTEDNVSTKRFIKR